MTTDEKKQHILLKDKNIYRGLLALSLPLMFSNLLRSIHDIVDMYFVADIGTGAVSSISITWSMIFIFLSFSFGLGGAGTALISQFLGANNKIKARRTTGQLFIIAIVLGVASNILLYTLAPTVLRWSGTEGFVYENALKYLRIRSFEMLPLFIFTVYMSIRQASGDTLSPVILNTVAVVVNIILSPILIRVFNMGVPGAAYATIIANFLIFPVTIYYLRFSKTGVTISTSDLIPDKALIREVLKIAIPSSLAQSITAIGFAIMNSMIMHRFGEVVFDAFGVGNRINSLVLLPIIAVSTVLSTFIGQNVGADQVDRAKEIFKKAIYFTVSFAVLGILLVMPFRIQIIGLFLHNEASIQLCNTYMFYLTLTLPMFALFQLLLGVFRGLGKATFTLILSLSRLWVFRIPMILLFVYFLDMSQDAVWHAMWLSNIFAVVLGYILYRRCDFKPIVQEPTEYEGEFV